jgi:hypothetical protein
MTNLKNHVESMIGKAAKAEKSEDAMRFSQAALNAANAMCPLGGVLPVETLREALGHLGAALVQSASSDDQIIIEHVRDAKALIEKAMEDKS